MPAVRGSISDGTSKNRDKNDFYETPQDFTRELLKRVDFHNEIWEPTCGNGALTSVLEEHDYRVFSSDLVARDYPCEQLDFLTQAGPTNMDIVANPPFKLLPQFLKQSHRLCHRKFALVMPISGLNSSRRWR